MMTINDALITLGKDPVKVMSGVLKRRDIDGLDGMINETEAVLKDVKLIAKKLLAVHHPDKGGSEEAFRRVQEALKCVEDHTISFKETIEKRRELSNKNNTIVFIK